MSVNIPLNLERKDCFIPDDVDSLQLSGIGNGLIEEHDDKEVSRSFPSM